MIGIVPEVAAIFRRDQFLAKRAGHGGQLLEAVLAVDRDLLANAMIVVAPDHMGGMIPHPFNARRWLQTVIDEIAQDQAVVERLLGNRL